MRMITIVHQNPSLKTTPKETQTVTHTVRDRGNDRLVVCLTENLVVSVQRITKLHAQPPSPSLSHTHTNLEPPQIRYTQFVGLARSFVNAASRTSTMWIAVCAPRVILSILVLTLSQGDHIMWLHFLSLLFDETVCNASPLTPPSPPPLPRPSRPIYSP